MHPHAALLGAVSYTTRKSKVGWSRASPYRLRRFDIVWIQLRPTKPREEINAKRAHTRPLPCACGSDCRPETTRFRKKANPRDACRDDPVETLRVAPVNRTLPCKTPLVVTSTQHREHLHPTPSRGFHPGSANTRSAWTALDLYTVRRETDELDPPQIIEPHSRINARPILFYESRTELEYHEYFRPCSRDQILSWGRGLVALRETLSG